MSGARKMASATVTSPTLNHTYLKSDHLKSPYGETFNTSSGAHRHGSFVPAEAELKPEAPKVERKKYVCTFAGCNLEFDNERALIFHKSSTPEHEYCKRCNLDFVDDDELFLHKLVDPKHIVCPVCSQEFKSNGGRELHMKQSHKTEQKLACVGCGQYFTRAATLMGHIERGECRNIKSTDFLIQRNQKDIMQAALRGDDELESPDGSEPDLDRGGGVSISEITGGMSEERVANPYKASVEAIKKEREYRAVESMHKQMDANFPAIPSSATKKTKKEPVDLLTGDINDMQINPDPKAAWSKFSDVHRQNQPEIAKWAARVAQQAANMEDPETTSLTNDVLKSYDDKKEWNPYAFFNGITGMFDCPHRSCKRSYNTVKEFEDHLLSPAHTGGTIRCPTCLRIFKSHMALVSHCENSYVRCKINKSANFRQIMDQITGGLIDVASDPWEDGTVKFVAADKTAW